MFLIEAFEPLKQESLLLTRDSGGNSPVSTALGRSGRSAIIQNVPGKAMNDANVHVSNT